MVYACRNETVQSIVAAWHRELGADLALFQEQARRVSAWDTQLRENMQVCVCVYCTVYTVWSIWCVLSA